MTSRAGRLVAACLPLVSAVLAGALTGCSTGVVPGPSVEPAVGPSYTPERTGFRGQQLYVSTDSQAARWARGHGATSWLAPIIGQPQARWVNGPSDLGSLERASRAAAAQGGLVTAVAYDIPNRGCDHGRQGAPDPAGYHAFVDEMVAALDGRPAVVILEPDAVAADCYTADRAGLLAWASHRLTAAGHYVYLDAGHAGWRASGLMAQRLVASGITQASGFAVNVSARDSTADSRSYGEELSSLVGNRAFVVDTSRNGQPAEPSGGAVAGWCNPPQQGLGERPRALAVGHNVAVLWIKNPGESDGRGPECGGDTAYAGLFSPRQARRLIAGAGWVQGGARSRLPAERSLPWTH